MHSTLEAARRHLLGVDPDALLHSRNRLAETGIARLGFLLPHRVKRALAAEALALVEHHRQWGEQLPIESAPPSHGIDIPPRTIDAHAVLIPQLYDCDALRHNLSVVAAETVLPRPDPPRYAIVRRHHDAPCQWHWDDYSFAFVLVVECPPLAEGGFVQTVAHTRRSHYREDIHRTLTRNPIRSWELQPGDLYFMRTASTLHRVYPFEHGHRTIVSMSFAARGDPERERTARANADRVPDTPGPGLITGEAAMTNQVP
ncbi:hypothetical protein FOH10_27505 [Nocardia otitidiscaviarum]|uniref:Fe2OG dioxygenase domain-containing protein n=1 Tax=Nocardia otitidiscaviarum TaxID=1823 RepID=A0A516NSP8_9NOCA|nr:hypothetical protein [Nocardia otitidiscaviarum]MCP9621179.1 hypothetical protein [Nocardia otitidiscaviarum]QDP81929.1 hypothetical protein FOH10_27505 [Nocardia otitidiscaviarum]